MKNAASKMIWAHCATQPARNSIRHCDAVSAKHVSGFFQRQSLFYWRHNSVVSGFFTIGSKQFQSCIRIIKWFFKKCKSRLVTSTLWKKSSFLVYGKKIKISFKFYRLYTATIWCDNIFKKCLLCSIMYRFSILSGKRNTYWYPV